MILLNEMFEDHMVLQREMSLPVWGKCDHEQAEVTVSVAGVSGTAKVKKGCFRVDLPPLSAGGPWTLTASCGNELAVCRDVLVGEVWLAGGQSNMEMPLFAAEGTKAWLAEHHFGNLRFKTISRRSYSEDGREFGFHFISESSDIQSWQLADESTAACFSAIGCVAGDRISQRLGVPVGVISCNYGATKVQPWVSPEALGNNPVFDGDEELFNQKQLELGDEGEKAWLLFQQDLKNDLVNHDEFVAKSLEDPMYYWKGDASVHWPMEYAPGDQNKPSCLYRYMLARVFPFAMRGVLWYQGESSATFADCARYREEMEALVDDWRIAFENERLVFIQTQLAAYDTSRRADPCDWPVVRQAQLELCASRSGVFVTHMNGISETRNIHPRFKIEAGERFADVALNKVYGCQTPVAPQPVSAEREGSWIRIRFAHGDGLHVEGDAIQLEAGTGNEFVPVTEYYLEGDCLLVHTNASTIRYGWSPIPCECLQNRDGMSSVAFEISV